MRKLKDYPNPKYPKRKTMSTIEIRINEYNETLKAFKAFNDQINENDINMEFRYTVLHKKCHGIMTLTPISETYNALICKECFLRIIIPNNLKTWKDLIYYFNNKDKAIEETNKWCQKITNLLEKRANERK